MRLLIVEDNDRLAASLARGFLEEGFEAELASSGSAALARIGEPIFEVIILDLGLPDVDGQEVITRARRSAVETPILVLTARDAIASRVQALEHGADDYVLKPFSFAELLARVRALIRRAAAPRRTLQFTGRLVLHPGGNEVSVDGRRIALSPRERMLLEVLLKRSGETVSRPEILSEAFGYTFDPQTNLIDVHVAHLRKKLGDGPVRIETVRGQGFRLVLEGRNERA